MHGRPDRSAGSGRISCHCAWRMRALSDQIPYRQLALRRGMEPHCFCSRIADAFGEIHAENDLHSFALTVPAQRRSRSLRPMA